MPRYADISAFSDEENTLWMMLIDNQNKQYYTMKQLPFRYSIKGNELFVSRKEKSITRSSVNQAFRRVIEITKAGEAVTGAKRLGTFGASYLYPIFIELGIIKIPNRNLKKCDMTDLVKRFTD